MAIKVDLSKTKRARWTTQHFGPEEWKPMVIPNLYCCIGVFIFSETKDKTNPIYSITAAHLPPHGGKEIKRVRKEFMQKLCNDLRYSEPYLIVIAGGKINTIHNMVHYRRSLRYFIFPFKWKFPNVQIMAFRPSLETVSTRFGYSLRNGFRVTRFVLPK
ncbi:MAG: hypothetical protein V4665_03800 [Patescibacteria group bacterium]